MKIYATFNPAGLPAGFYNDDVYPDVVVYGDVPAATEAQPHPVAPETSRTRNPAIPAAAVEISAAQWRDFLANQSQRRWDGTKVVPYQPPAPPAPKVEAISGRQFFQGLAVRGLVTQAEALAAVRTGTLPAALQALVDQLPAEQQFGALMLLSGATTFQRSHPLAAVIGAAFGKDAAWLDGFWQDAGAL